MRLGAEPLPGASRHRLPGLLAGAIASFQRLWLRIWRPDSVFWLLVLAVLLLPLMMLSAVAGATVSQMKLQAGEISTLASGIRAYYADNVIARLQAADGKAVYSENYREVHGGIPIPATLSIELGALFDNAHNDGRIAYEFLSDYPFAKRLSHPLDRFESEAIKAFRADPERKVFSQLSGNGIGRSAYRMATPVLMRQACVTCHNSHPDSPKRDWKVGDVRGIQEVTVLGIQVNGFGRLGLLVGYVGFLGLTSVAATSVFRSKTRQLATANQQLLEANRKDSSLAAELADQIRELSIFGHVVDNAHVGIAIADMGKPDQPLIYVNQAFTTITGYSRELCLGYNCRFLQGPETDPEELERLRRAIRAGEPYSGELINVRADGRRFWNRLMLYPIFSSHDQLSEFYVGNLVDISSLRPTAGSAAADLGRLGAEIEVAQQALRQAERFSQGLRGHLEGPGFASAEAEAFLIAEQSAHQQLSAALHALSQHIADPQQPG